jgi:hypothetical protein
MQKSRRNMDSWQFQGSSHTYRSRPFYPGQAAPFTFFDIFGSFGTNLGISCKVDSLSAGQKDEKKSGALT